MSDDVIGPKEDLDQTKLPGGADAMIGPAQTLKRIAPEEAYDKAIDKRKFRTFLPHPPDDDES